MFISLKIKRKISFPKLKDQRRKEDVNMNIWIHEMYIWSLNRTRTFFLFTSVTLTITGGKNQQFKICVRFGLIVYFFAFSLILWRCSNAQNVWHVKLRYSLRKVRHLVILSSLFIFSCHLFMVFSNGEWISESGHCQCSRWCYKFQFYRTAFLYQ